MSSDSSANGNFLTQKIVKLLPKESISSLTDVS